MLDYLSNFDWLSFLYNYGWVITLVSALCIKLYLVYKKYGKLIMLKELRETAYKLMLASEKKFDIGKEKKDWVAAKLYFVLPDSLKIFIDIENVEKFVQDCYDEAKDYLDDGKFNDSIHSDLE